VVFVQYVEFDKLREIAGTSINSSYQIVGAPFTVNPRIIAFHNSTDVDLYVSTNGSTNMLRIASNSFKIHDLQANKSSTGDSLFPMSIGIWVKETSEGAPTKGEFWVEAIYSPVGQ
jgi:hypothetical protein